MGQTEPHPRVRGRPPGGRDGDAGRAGRRSERLPRMGVAPHKPASPWGDPRFTEEQSETQTDAAKPALTRTEHTRAPAASPSPESSQEEGAAETVAGARVTGPADGGARTGATGARGRDKQKVPARSEE